jgi:hypothetical protein
MLRPTVSRPVCLGIKHSFGAYDQIFVTVRHLRVCSCGALSLTRGQVCRLQLLLVLASAIIFLSESHFTVSVSRLPFSSPPTTRRATVELFYLPPSHGSLSRSNLSLCLSLILRPTVSRPVCPGIKYPSGAYDKILITVRQLRVCWCGAFCLMRGRVCRSQLLLALASAVILMSESLGTRDHILPSQIRHSWGTRKCSFRFLNLVSVKMN